MDYKIIKIDMDLNNVESINMYYNDGNVKKYISLSTASQVYYLSIIILLLFSIISFICGLFFMI